MNRSVARQIPAKDRIAHYMWHAACVQAKGEKEFTVSVPNVVAGQRTFLCSVPETIQMPVRDGWREPIRVCAGAVSTLPVSWCCGGAIDLIVCGALGVQAGWSVKGRRSALHCPGCHHSGLANIMVQPGNSCTYQAWLLQDTAQRLHTLSSVNVLAGAPSASARNHLLFSQEKGVRDSG